MPGSRLIEGRFTAVQQSIGVPRLHAAAAAYLTAFVREIVSSGLLRTTIDRHHARGLSIAPLAPDLPIRSPRPLMATATHGFAAGRSARSMTSISTVASAGTRRRPS